MLPAAVDPRTVVYAALYTELVKAADSNSWRNYKPSIIPARCHRRFLPRRHPGHVGCADEDGSASEGPDAIHGARWDGIKNNLYRLSMTRHAEDASL